MFKDLRFLALIAFVIINMCVQEANAQGHGLVHWISLEEAEKRAKENPKPLLIDIYTDWCGWCKRMVATTYSDQQVANYINENFYPVQFNAETKDTIVFQGQTYVSKEPAKNGTHQLAYKFLPQSRSYPSTIFMDGQLQNSLLAPGYLDAKTIAPILVLYKEKLYADVNVNEFMAYFDSTFTPGNSVKKKELVKWMPMQQALDNNLKKPKKVFVSLYTPDCVSCKVMDSTTFTNPVVAAYLNENFYPVRFDATSKEEVNILNQKLGSNGYYHTLAQAAMKNEMEFPAMLFFNEKNELISPVPQFMTAKTLEPVLEFFKKDIYTQKQFPEFVKTYQGKIK